MTAHDVDGFPLPPRGKDPEDWTADETEGFLRLMLREREMEAVYQCLVLMVRKDVHRAELLRDTLRVGIALAQRATQTDTPS